MEAQSTFVVAGLAEHLYEGPLGCQVVRVSVGGRSRRRRSSRKEARKWFGAAEPLRRKTMDERGSLTSYIYIYIKT